MAQLVFEFTEKLKYVIRFPLEVRATLVRQMARAIVEVNRKEMEKSNEDFTNQQDS